MIPNAITPRVPPAASRPAGHVLLAAALLVFASAVAPLCALTAACSMPCCAGASVPFVSAPPDPACAEHCAVSSDAASHQLPDAVAISQAAQIGLAALSLVETSDGIAPTPPARFPASSVESHHAVPGDAPLYIHNSAFLI